MGIREDIQAQINELETKLAALNRVGEDTFAFGTIVVFSAASDAKWYYVKEGEESWSKMTGSGSRSLAEWIVIALDSGVGYFEVYAMVTAETPFFASA